MIYVDFCSDRSFIWSNGFLVAQITIAQTFQYCLYLLEQLPMIVFVELPKQLGCRVLLIWMTSLPKLLF